MYLTIDTVIGARLYRHSGGDADTRHIVTVTCAHPYRLDGRVFQVEVTAASVTVREVDPADHDMRAMQPHADLARVLVAPDLIDAARRLYNLVG